MNTPAYLVYEERLLKNLRVIDDVRTRSGADIIMALKANALWRTFPVMRPFITGATASSLNEARLARDFLTDNVHVYAPVYTPADFRRFADISSHLTFNTLSQYEAHLSSIRHRRERGEHLPSFGLRVNPHLSVVETDIYNPCIPGSRFGMTAGSLPSELPRDIEGFHVHALCEGSADQLEALLGAVEEQFGQWLPSLRWLNLGGGHLMTRADYDREKLIRLIVDFRKRHPNLQIIMEPGSAFTWQTGDLVVTVLDVVEDAGIRTAIIDASFACHMPDTLEMPYRPNIAEAIPDDSTEGYLYRLGGNSCLSGDYCGPWRFPRPLEAGDRLTLLDMNHYTNVKTTMFNGLQHPSVYLQPADVSLPPLLLRRYTYADYKRRMS